MKEYIERESVAPAIDEQVEISPSDWKFIDRAIASIPAADVVEHKRGEWVEKEFMYGDVYYDCSVCGESFCLIDGTPTDNLYNFCPNCGADMRRTEEPQ